MSLPVLHGDRLDPERVSLALREQGGFLLASALPTAVWQQALGAARDFFALSTEVKSQVAIERSPHFRGWSEMHNERDWREQIHLGRDRTAGGPQPPYLRLEGPNLWPADDGWRASITAYMDAVASLGEQVLGCVAGALGLAASPFAGIADEGYLLMKLIGYHPQEQAHVQRSGVASHVDFSWITLTLQDSPGLEVRTPAGDWAAVEPLPGALWVHGGELLQMATAHLYQATPHRVVNPSPARTRISIPLFVNPPLAGRVELLRTGPAPSHEPSRDESGEHVHRVLAPGAPAEPFLFGPAEWRRKALNGWCHRCAPAASEAPLET